MNLGNIVAAHRASKEAAEREAEEKKRAAQEWDDAGKKAAIIHLELIQGTVAEATSQLIAAEVDAEMILFPTAEAPTKVILRVDPRSAPTGRSTMEDNPQWSGDLEDLSCPALVFARGVDHRIRVSDENEFMFGSPRELNSSMSMHDWVQKEIAAFTTRCFPPEG